MKRSLESQRFRRKLLVGASIWGLLILIPLLAYFVNLVRTSGDDPDVWQGYLLVAMFLLVGAVLVVQLVWNVRKLRSHERWRPFGGLGQYVPENSADKRAQRKGRLTPDLAGRGYRHLVV
jgi:hypothetical protein